MKIFPKVPNKLNYFTALAAAYAKTGNIEETERIFAEIVVEDQSSLSGKLAAANALGQVAIAHANEGHLEEAFRTLERLKERTKQEKFAVVGDVTARLADAQAKQGHIDQAVQTALIIAAENPYPLMTIVGDRVRNGNMQEAQRIIAALEEGAQRYAQWGVMQAQIGQGHLIEAQVTASAIKPGHAKASALLELAVYHRKHGGQRLALTLLQEAEASARSTVNPWTRADILWRIAAETASSGDAEHALAIAKSIEPEGHRRAAIYDIAKAQAKRGEFAGAFNTANLLKQTSSTPQTATGYAEVVLEVLIEMVKAGKGREAQDTAGRFPVSDIRRSRLYSGVAMAYAELGNVKEAQASLALIETKHERTVRRKELKETADNIRLRQEPSDKSRFQEFILIEDDLRCGLEAIAKALARKGDLRGATAVVDELDETANRHPVIKDLTFLHTQSGRTEDTLRWARSLSRRSEKVFALVGIATALSQETDKKKSKRTSTHKTSLSLSHTLE